MRSAYPQRVYNLETNEWVCPFMQHVLELEDDILFSTILYNVDDVTRGSLKRGLASDLFTNSEIKVIADCLREERLNSHEGNIVVNSLDFLKDIMDTEDVTNNFEKHGQYDPIFVYQLFVAGHMQTKSFMGIDDITPELAIQKRETYRKTFGDYVSQGGDLETVRLMLNKEIQEEMEAGEDTSELEDLLLKAEEISSPYDELFALNEQIITLQNQYDEMMNDPSVSEDKTIAIQDKITEMKIELKQKCKNFDPYMLKQVASARIENVKLNNAAKIKRDGETKESLAAKGVLEIGEQLIKERNLDDAKSY